MVGGDRLGVCVCALSSPSDHLADLSLSVRFDRLVLVIALSSSFMGLSPSVTSRFAVKQQLYESSSEATIQAAGWVGHDW